MAWVTIRCRCDGKLLKNEFSFDSELQTNILFRPISLPEDQVLICLLDQFYKLGIVSADRWRGINYDTQQQVPGHLWKRCGTVEKLAVAGIELVMFVIGQQNANGFTAVRCEVGGSEGKDFRHCDSWDHLVL